MNQPYSGSIVPGSFYHKDASVCSIMVEVNRSLYMNEVTGERSTEFGAARRKIQLALGAVIADAIQAIT